MEAVSMLRNAAGLQTLRGGQLDSNMGGDFPPGNKPPPAIMTSSTSHVGTVQLRPVQREQLAAVQRFCLRGDGGGCKRKSSVNGKLAPLGYDAVPSKGADARQTVPRRDEALRCQAEDRPAEHQNTQ
jgi:hypothetical protein